jgi:hypothetical protein
MHMANGTPESQALYTRFRAILDSLGPYSVHPAKTSITFKGSRRGFCGAHPKKSALIGYFDLMRPLEPDKRIKKIYPYTKTLFVHQFRVVSSVELDAVFRSWLAEAYLVGQGAHLAKSRA